MPHAGDKLHRVGLNSHTPAAAVALLAAPQFPIDVFQRDGHTRGKPSERGHQTLAMRLTSGFKTKHREENLSLAQSSAKPASKRLFHVHCSINAAIPELSPVLKLSRD